MTVKFNILGQQVSFDEGHALCVKLRNTYDEQANKCCNEFRNNFDSKYYDLESFISNAGDDVNEMLYNSIDSGVNFLNSLGIYDIDFDSFVEYCNKYIGSWDEAFNEVVEKYNELIDYKQDAKEYRKERKDSRGRSVGGGFGISGALKGTAKAGALNATTGLMHSFANALGNAATSAEVGNKMSQIFNDEEARNNLENSVYGDVFSICFSLIDVINEKTNYNVDFYYTGDNYKQAQIIYNNLINNKIPENKIQEALSKMLIAYPFSDSYYEVALNYYKDDDKQIEKYAEYFGIDVSTIKNRIESEIQGEKKLIEIFGEDKKQYLDSTLGNNIFYEDLKDKLCGDILKNLIMAYEVNTDIFSDKLYINNYSQKFQEKLTTAIESYSIPDNEFPLIIFDNTSFGSAKDGFILTDKALYVHNMWSKTWIEALSNITEVLFNGSKIIINDKEIYIDLISKNNKSSFKAYTEFAIHLTNILGQTTEVLSKTLPDKIDNKITSNEKTYSQDNCSIEESISKLVSNASCDDIRDKLLLPNNSEKIAKKIENIKSSYARLDTSEAMLVFFDNTAFGSAKDGFCITNKKIYVHNMMEKPFLIDLFKINSVEISGGNLIINEFKIDIQLISKKNRDEFKNLISNIITSIRG